MCAFMHVAGNEEEEESLTSFYTSAADVTAVTDDDKAEVVEGLQRLPGDDSFTTESQRSPKFSAMLRNKVQLYCLLHEHHKHVH